MISPRMGILKNPKDQREKQTLRGLISTLKEIVNQTTPSLCPKKTQPGGLQKKGAYDNLRMKPLAGRKANLLLRRQRVTELRPKASEPPPSHNLLQTQNRLPHPRFHLIRLLPLRLHLHRLPQLKAQLPQVHLEHKQNQRLHRP